MTILRRRPKPPKKPAPTPPADFTVAEIRAIRTALQIAIVHHVKNDAWPAAELAQHTLDKIPNP